MRLFLKRAKIVLDEFKKQNVDFANIPWEKGKDADDKDTALRHQQFIERVNKYFPEYLKQA